tara:strand:- start:33398 stop:33592 length:195 start_codon:yes stop_codon:yes gene_type:complete
MEYEDYKIEIDGTMGYYSVKPKGKGSVPTQLRGLYTTRQFAINAIDLQKSMKKGKTDGKTDTST